jgi:hypothetical protein
MKIRRAVLEGPPRCSLKDVTDRRTEHVHNVFNQKLLEFYVKLARAMSSSYRLGGRQKAIIKYLMSTQSVFSRANTSGHMT